MTSAGEPGTVGCTGRNTHPWRELDRPPAVAVGPDETWSLAEPGEPYRPGLCPSCGRDDQFSVRRADALITALRVFAGKGQGVDISLIP